MKVIELRGENYKRLHAVDLHLGEEPGIRWLKGKNGQGKSSIIELLWWVIAGAEGAKEVPMPVRIGAEKVFGELEFSDGTRARKTQTATGQPRLVVTDPEGRQYTSPQGIMDALRGALSFDLGRFIEASPKEQLAMLMEATGQKELLDELEAECKEAYDERTVVNREVRRLEALVKSHSEVDPSLEVKDAQAILARLKEANDLVAKRRDLASRAAEAERRADEEAKRILDLQHQLAEAEAEQQAQRAQGEAWTQEFEGIEVPDVEVLNAELADVEEHNAEARKAEAVRRDAEALKGARAESTALSARIEKAQEVARSVVLETAIPVPGLGFTEEGLTFDGAPFVQASQAAKVTVAAGIAFAQNPKLRLICVRRANDLDEDSVRVLDSLAKERDFVVLAERVGKDGPSGWIIEDGRVLEAPPAAAQEAA